MSTPDTIVTDTPLAILAMSLFRNGGYTVTDMRNSVVDLERNVRNQVCRYPKEALLKLLESILDDELFVAGGKAKGLSFVQSMIANAATTKMRELVRTRPVFPNGNPGSGWVFLGCDRRVYTGQQEEPWYLRGAPATPLVDLWGSSSSFTLVVYGNDPRSRLDGMIGHEHNSPHLIEASRRLVLHFPDLKRYVEEQDKPAEPAGPQGNILMLPGSPQRD